MNRFVLLLMLLVLPLTGQGQTQRAYFDKLTTVDGLPENSVACLLQDHLGFMWLGTQNGLVRYDGTRMLVYQYTANDPYSLRHNIISCLYEDRQGDLWIGCLGGLYRFERATQRFINYSPNHSDQFSSQEKVMVIHQDKMGDLWIITDSAGLNILRKYTPKAGIWTRYQHEPSKSSGLVYSDVLIMSATGVRQAAMVEDQQGTIWVVTRKGRGVNSEALLHRYDRATDTFRSYQPKGVSARHPPLQFVKLPRFDRKGMLWVATNGNGLYRINPSTNQLIAHYRNDPKDPRSLCSDTVRTVYEDRSGLLWISTIQGLERLDPKTGFFTHFPHDPSNPDSPQEAVLDGYEETANGHIWFTTALKGLEEYDPTSGRFIHYERNPMRPGYLAAGKVGPFLIDRSNLIWAGTQQTGLNKETKMTRFTQFDYASTLPTNDSFRKVSIIYEAPSDPNILWIGTNEGLDRYEKKTGKHTHYALDVKNIEASGNDRVSAIKEDRKGRLWVGTTNGLYLMDRKRGTFTRYMQNQTNANTLNYNFIKTILAASDGTLWIGTTKGLNHFYPEENQFTHYYRADTVYHPELFQFIKSLSIPTRQIAVAWHKKNYRSTTTSFTLDKPTVVAVSAMGGISPLQKMDYGWIEDARGNKVWEMEYGRTRFAGSDEKRMQVDKLLLPSGFYRLVYKGDDRGAQATFNYPMLPTPYYPELWGIQVLRLSDAEANQLTALTKKWAYKGLSGINISALYEDSKGRVWIGTYEGGLNRYDPITDQFTVYREPLNGLLAITTIYEDTKGMLWIGDYLHGLFVFNPDTGVARRYTTANGLPHTSVTGIVSDNRGNLWLSTFNGLCRLDLVRQTFRSYTKTHGLRGLVFRYPSFRSSDGTLYFPGDHGISVLSPNQLFDDSYPPPVVLTDITIFDQKVAIGPTQPLQTDVSIADKITVAHDQNELTFYFAALHYNRSQECRYAFRLEPYDKNWVQAGTTQQARYTALKAGTYTFRVKAANADGVWNNKGASIMVIVRPPWWYTWWAYMLYGLLLGGSIVGFLHYRSRALRRENQQLEEKVTLRTTQLQQSLNELKAAQNQLIQKEKMASLGELTAGIAHEIQNPLNFVNNFAEVSVELAVELEQSVQTDEKATALELATDLRTNMQHIAHNGQRASSIVRAMLEHSRSSTGERQLTDLNALCDEYLRLAYHGIRAKDHTFTCELITAFAADLPAIDVVPQDIGRVLLNLYNNAFYAVSQRAGSLVQGAWGEDEAYQPTVWVSTRLSGGTTERRLSGGSSRATTIVISVRDNGTGIPQAIQSKIFQPFFTTKPTGEGTGLGLSLSYDIVTKGHGGALMVESEEGEGTELIIELPQKRVFVHRQFT